MKRRDRERDKPAEQPADRDQAEHVIPVIEEEIIIDKKIVRKGGIIIKKVVLPEDVSFDVPLMQEHLDIQRIPVNKFLDSRPEIRHEGNTIIIPVLREVIEKRLLLVEEIHITRTASTESVSEKVTLSKEKVTITRKEDDSPGTAQ